MRLGVVNVDRDILRGLTAKQFRAWEHYAELEPFDETRADYRAASIVQMLYNVNRGSKQKAVALEDVVLKFGAQEKKDQQKQTPQQQFAILKVLAAMHANERPSIEPAPDGPRPQAEQAEIEAKAAEQLAMIETARKAMH